MKGVRFTLTLSVPNHSSIIAFEIVAGSPAHCIVLHQKDEKGIALCCVKRIRGGAPYPPHCVSRFCSVVSNVYVNRTENTVGVPWTPTQNDQ